MRWRRSHLSLLQWLRRGRGCLLLLLLGLLVVLLLRLEVRATVMGTVMLMGQMMRGWWRLLLTMVQLPAASGTTTFH